MPIMLVDGNAVGRAASYTKPLIVDGREVQAIYQTLKILKRVKSEFHDFKPLILWDSRSDYRLQIYPEYKSNRDSDPKKVEASVKYHAVKPDLMKLISYLGIDQAIAHGYEADDLAGFFCRRTNAQVLLVTGDHDWLQLVSDNVAWYDCRTDRNLYIDSNVFEDATGFGSPEAFLEGKILQGDSSDAISGINKIGPKGAIAIVSWYGSFEHLLDSYTNGEPLPDSLNRYKKALEEALSTSNRDQTAKLVERNRELMNLRSPKHDDDIKCHLHLNRGNRDFGEFEYLCAELSFVSIRKNLEQWKKVFS